jgi:hypothetical protein
MSDTGLAMPSVEARLTIIDAWHRAFPRTPKVMLLNDEAGLRHAAKLGCGWRADCLGDLGGPSKSWNHMDHFYRQQVAKAETDDGWRRAPVAFESCWDMRQWKRSGFDIDSIFDYALEMHASYLNNKSMPLPDGTRHQVERLLRGMGYRLVLRRLRHESTVEAGRALQVSLEWENVGVAPPYFDYRLALRLTPVSEGEPVISVQETSIRGWLPGARSIEALLRVPEGLPARTYDLAVAIVEPSTGVPAVRLAIAGRTDSGWYPLSQVEVR